MKKRLLSLVILIGILTSLMGVANAQSNIDFFFTACEDRGVFDASGTMQANYDIYYQAFDNFGATGNALTGLRQVRVDGDYAISDVVTYNDGRTVPFGGFASVTVSMARETDPTITIFEQTIDVVQDGCAEPANPLTDSNDTSSSEFEDGELISSSGVFTPSGGLLNPVFAVVEPLVVIGARPSEQVEPGRTNNPGLIFAECSDVAGADPGVLYDTDELVLFWSWFARTPQQVQDHIDNALYDIRISGQTLPRVNVSAIKQVPGSRNWWVFYTVNLGDKWRPGQYGVTFKLEWANPISDGFDDFGPGTENDLFHSGCPFRIRANPYGIDVVPENPKVPLEAF